MEYRKDSFVGERKEGLVYANIFNDLRYSIFESISLVIIFSVYILLRVITYNVRQSQNSESLVGMESRPWPSAKFSISSVLY